MKNTLFAVFLLPLLGACASTALTAGKPVGCGPRPTPAQVSAAVQTYIAQTPWRDPSSVRFANVRMQPCRSIWNGLMAGGGHTIGREIDFDVNATNGFGGYTGYQVKSIILTPDGAVHWDM